MNSKAAELIACPVCKGDLKQQDGSLTCEHCSVDYPVTDSIPQLFPPSDNLTIDPAKLRIKTREEASNTLEEMALSDHGFISSPRHFYALYLLLLVTLLFRLESGIFMVVALLLADWIFFRVRRERVLEKDLANTLRLRTVADYGAVDEIYRREGKTQPTMTDWVRLAGGTSESEDQDDERYRDILRVYQREDAEAVLDVGANDGRAYFKFGIGRGKTFIGIDVSRLLLAEFMQRVPDQTALQADGICLPLKDSSVDFLFCTETLEHLADPQQAMLEFGRVLRPGGRLMVQSPNAHRIRNLNPFHIATNAASLLTDRILQKKVVHENTWLNAATYHWDFSVQDYRVMAGKAGLKVTELRSGQFFFPRFLMGGGADAFRRKEELIGSIPLLRMFGGDLVLVASASVGESQPGA
jgi:ubiquinone/menaquinone biosynthesis C-methylase UbiE/uncharacterized protein YbaR (Trm112 family)